MMTAIGGTAITNGYYWTSTHYDASTYSWGLGWYGGGTGGGNRNDDDFVRAFRAL